MDKPLFGRDGKKTVSQSSAWSVIQSILLLGLIAAFVPVTVVLFERYNALSSTTNGQIELLQSEVIELMLSSATTTNVLNGTCRICDTVDELCPTLIPGTIPFSLYEYSFGTIFFRVLEIQQFPPVTLPVGGIFAFRDCNVQELVNGQNVYAGVGSVFTSLAFNYFTPQQKIALPFPPGFGGPTLDSIYFTYVNAVEGQFQFFTGFSTYAGEPFALNSPLRIPLGSFNVQI